MAGFTMISANPWFSRTTRKTWSTAGTAGVGEGVGVGIGVGVGLGGAGVGVGVAAGKELDAMVEDPPPQLHMPSRTTVAINNVAHDLNIALPLRWNKIRCSRVPAGCP
jgi:F0F1-type ATP synthase membrane subunit c/vacuolar-type H+-ATPase subunit K